MMNGIGSRVALSLCALLGLAGCGSGSSTDASVDAATSCGPDMDTPCCGPDVIGEGEIGPVMHAETSAAAVTGQSGDGVLDSVDAAGADATCITDLIGTGAVECRSSWSLTMSDGTTTRIESSLSVDDVSWLVGQTVHLATREGERNLSLIDATGRLLIVQMSRFETYDTADVVTVPGANGFTLSVRVTPEDAVCRKWTSPCWLQDVFALDVTTADGSVHSLGPGESSELVADGLRYRVTDRILASRSRLRVNQCADVGRETWSYDVVALGPAP